jgi:hypothetical protein
MADIGTARVLITGDYSGLAADFNAAQGVASTGASAIGRSVQQAFTPASLIVDQFGRSIQSAAVSVAAAAPPVLDLEGAVTRLAFAQAILKQSVDSTTTSLGHEVTQIQAVSGTLRTLESNGGIRAAERFLTLIPGLGAALQVAFPIVGAIALAEVFGRLLGKSEELKQAEQELAAATTAADNAFKSMEDTLDHLNVEHVTAIFGAAAGKGAEKTVLEQQAARIKVQMDDLRDSINEVAYAEANSLKNYVPFHSNEASVDKIKTIGQQIKDLNSQLIEVEGKAGATGEDAGRAAAQQAGQLVAARLKSAEEGSQQEAALKKQLSQASIESDHAAAVAHAASLTSEYAKVVETGNAEKEFAQRKASDEAGYALALRDRTIQYIQQRAAAESAGKSQPDQDIIGVNAAAEIQKAKNDYTKTVQDGQVSTAKAGQDATLKLVEVNEKLAQTLQGSVMHAYDGLLDTIKKVAAADAERVDKDATDRVRALEEQTKIAGAIGKGQGEIAAAQLKAQYEQQHIHSLEQEITYRQQLAAIQDQQYTAELTALAARRSDAQALTDEVEKSKQLADIDARIADLSAKAQSAKIASQGQVDALQQNPIQQMGKEFSSVGIKDVDVQVAKNLGAAVNNVAAGLANAIVHAKGFGQAITAAGKQLATALLTTVLEAGLKRVVGALLSLLPALTTVSSAQAAAAVQQKAIAQASVLTAAGEAAAWAFESVMAALPFPVNVAVAPEVAAAAFGQATAIGSFERGTDSAPGGLAMVGEKGPELLNLPRGAQVIPNDILRSAFNLPRATRGGNLGTPGGSAGLSSAGGGDLHVHLNGDFHAHGVNDPTRLAERMVDQIPFVLKRRSASFSPYSK